MRYRALIAGLMAVMLGLLTACSKVQIWLVVIVEIYLPTNRL